MTEWVTGQGLAVAGVVREVGSGLVGRRPKLRRVLSDPAAAVIVVEHRDPAGALRRGAPRRARWPRRAGGYWLPALGQTADDLAGEMIEVLTWMCARLDGARGARDRALRAVTAAKKAGVDAAAA